MEEYKFPPPPAVGQLERQECIRGDPIEPPDELNQAFIADAHDDDYRGMSPIESPIEYPTGPDQAFISDAHDDYRGMFPIEYGVSNLHLSPSTPDRRPKCTCPGAPPRPSLVTLEMPIDGLDQRSDSRLANSSESLYQMWNDGE